jgi:hypothetical protein
MFFKNKQKCTTVWTICVFWNIQRSPNHYGFFEDGDGRAITALLPSEY